MVSGDCNSIFCSLVQKVDVYWLKMVHFSTLLGDCNPL